MKVGGEPYPPLCGELYVKLGGVYPLVGVLYTPLALGGELYTLLPLGGGLYTLLGGEL